MTRAGLGEEDDGENVSLVQTELTVPGMVCEGCAQKITQVLMALEGVQKFLPEVKDKRVHVLHDPNQTSEEGLRDRFRKLSYS